MKQDANPKSKKWIVIVAIVAALLLIAGGVAAFFLLPGEQVDPNGTPVTSELYWNLDKALYTDNEIGLSTRERADDGLYHFRFASAGKLVELTTADAQIVNYLDTLEVMGLILDADGSIVDAIPVAELATEVAKEFFVKSVKGTTIQLNSSPAMNGMDVTFELTDAAYVMDVRPDTEAPAQAVTLEVMDTVWVYADADNVVTNVFLSKRPPKSEFYVRMNRFYANGETTRVPDENGVYTIPFAVNGEIVELKCKDKDLVSSIDSGTDTGAHMGLVFDEEGYIIEDMSGAEALRCAATATVFHVKEINGDQVTFVRKLPGSNQGQEVTLTVSENTQIINTELAYMSDSCWAFEYFGQLTDHLEIDDRVICYADSDGNAVVVTILCRMVDAKLYFNQSVMYNSTEKTTTRVPDEDGYYVYTFACEGKTVTLKTKSKAVATKVDSYTSGVVGLKVSGSTIKDACNPYCVAGWNITAKLIAREMMGTVVTLTSRWNIESVGGNYVIADGCQIFDVTGDHGVKYGAKTTVQVGDHVYGVRNAYGDLAYIFVTKRVASGTKLYYNTWRRYNTTTGETTRPADADGYYVYDLLTETGKLVQGKTKDKSMADFIDKQLSPFVSLKINSSGIITKAAFCEASLQWGMKYTNYHYIAKIDYENRTYSTYYISNGERFESYQDVPFADDVKMYNFSTNYLDYRGEKTKVRVDDRIQAFYDAGQNKVSHIYVLERYDPEVKKYCPHCDKKVTFYGYKSGAAPLGETTHYYIANDRYLSQMSVGSSDPEVEAKDRTEVIFDLNGHTLHGSSSRNALVYGDLTIIDTKGGGGLVGNINGWAGCLLVRNTGKVNLMAGTYSYSPDEKYAGATVGGIIYLAEDAVLNVAKGVKLINGRTSGNGGLIYMDGNSVANIEGAELGGGVAANGGNFYLAGKATLNIKDSTITTGSAVLGDNFYLASTNAKWVLDNVTYDGGIAIGTSMTYPITGKVNWTSPVQLRNGAKLDLTGMDPASKLAIDAEGVFTTDFADVETAEKYLGCFTVPQDYTPVYVSGKALATGLDVDAFVKREMATANAVKDLDPAKVVAGTTCPMCGAKDITWVKQTKEFWGSRKSHIYYEGTVGTAAAPIVANNFIGSEPGVEICVVFVNADIHTTGRVLLRANTNFSFMGKGTMTSNGNGIGKVTAEGHVMDRGLFNYVGSPIELNLYGGNYQYTGAGFGLNEDGTLVSGVPMYGVLSVTKDSVANIFNDVVIGNPTLDTSRTYYNVYTAGKLNMFGGTIQNGVSDTTSASGNVTVVGTGALNMYDKGGVIKGGVALGDGPIGANLTVNSKTAVLNLGNNVPEEGGIALNAAVTLAVNGKVNWTKPAYLRGGSKLNLTAMDPESKIPVVTESVFTTDFADAKTAEKYLGCFTVPKDYKPVYVSGKALATELELEAFLDREMGVANAVKDLDPAKVVLGNTCPMCGAKGVTWSKKTGSFWGSANSHIYYEGEVGTAAEPIAAGNFIGAEEGVEICVVLVDAKIHTTGRVLLRPNNNFSFMGNGTLISDGKSTGEGVARDRGVFNFVGAPIELNLYGGNYQYTGTGFGIEADGSVSSSTPIYSALNVSSGSVANIFNDTVIGNAKLDTSRTYYNVYTAGKLNMFGGTIQNGVSNTSTGSGNLTIGGSGSLNMYVDGGKIKGGVAQSDGAGANLTINSATASVNLGDTVLEEGGIAINAAYTLAVKGKVNWTKPVILRNKAKLDLTGMTTDSKMAIDADGVFTTDFADVETAEKYLGCFTVPQDYNPVYVSGKALATELNVEKYVEREMAVANAVKDLDPAKVVAGTTCPMCGAKNVTWVKQTKEFWGKSKSHIYYEGTVGTAAKPIEATNFITADTTVEVCVVFVNADIHTTGRVLMRTNNIFSFMGNGTLTSNGAGAGKGTVRDRGIFNLLTSNSELNLYGGNYVYTGTGFGLDEKDQVASTNVPSYALLNVVNGAVANIFNNTVIGNKTLDTSRAYYNVYTAGKVNMFGGTIQNGVSNTASGGGNVTLAGSGALNMYDKGGVITGSAALSAGVGANIAINSKSVVLNLGNTVVDGGFAINAAYTLPINGKVEWTKPVVLRSGAKLNLTGMDPESKLAIEADGIFTTNFADKQTAEKYLGCFTVPENCKPVFVSGNALAVELTLEAMQAKGDAVAALNPAEVVKGTTCPMCGATGITWKKNTGTTVYASSDVHVYYEGALGTAEEPITLMNLVYNYVPTGEEYTPKTMCIALVDADVYSTGRFLIRENDVMNIMGTGTIRSNGQTMDGQSKDLGLFTMLGVNPKLNLYGGNYIYTGTNPYGTTTGGANTTTTPVYALLGVPLTGTANIFNDVVIGNPEKDVTRDYKNTYILGTLNMFGGTIQNGVALEGEMGGNLCIGTSGTVNMYEGSAVKNGSTASMMVGGNVTMTGNGTLNVLGGTITGGQTLGNAVAGANMAINGTGVTLNLGNVAFDGGIAVNAAYTLPVNGKVEWTKPVILRGNAKLDLTGMDPKSKLAIDVEGVFTTDFADAATAEKYLGCFTVPQDFKPVYVSGKALATELELEAFINREMAVANAVKDLDPAKVVAGTTCPMCGAKNITWSKKTGAFWGTTKSHIYYEGAVGSKEAPIKTGNIITGDIGVQICVVFVNADIHTTGRVLMRTNNVFNFMGNGTLTSTGESTGTGIVRDRGVFNLLTSQCELNLYGGNYQYTGTGFGLDENDKVVSTGAPSYALLNVVNGAVANIFNNTVIGNKELDTSRTYYNVYNAGKINMFGGTIQNGVSDNTMGSGNVTLAGSGALNMYDKGGVIKGGAAINGASVGTNLTINSTAAVVNLGDKVLEGGIAINAARTWPITGKVNWTDPVVLRSGAKLDLTGMDPESKLVIDVEGVFTTDFADADTAKSYLNCFTVPATHKAVFVKGKALATELTIAAMQDRADALAELDPAEVVAGKTCPMCGATNVTWSKKTGAFWGYASSGTKYHIYYQGAVGTEEAPIKTGNIITGDIGVEICVVFVDADIHTTGRVLMRTNNVFNFMGNGTITSDGTATATAGYGDRGLFNLLTADCTLNLYGGNYEYTGAGFGLDAENKVVSTSTPNYALLNIAKGSVVNIFNDTVIGNKTLDTSRTYYNVYNAGTVNMFGGTIQNGVSNIVVGSGNVTLVGSGALNMYGKGGVIKGGTAIDDATVGTNLTINSTTAVVNLGDKVLEGGIAINAARTWTVTGKVNWTAPIVLRNSAKLDLTGMDPESKLVVDADGVFTTDFADAATAESYVDCITLPAGYKPAQVKGKALSAELEVETIKANAAAIAALNPAEVVAGNTCPMCGATNVTWSKQTGAVATTTNIHIYYEGQIGTATEPVKAGNLVYNSTASGANYAGKTMCIVLVDAEIYTTGRILLRPDDVMNIMGTGTITSDGTCTATAGYVDRGLFNFVGANIELNLYGGNYQYTGAGFGTNVPATTGNATYALLNVSAQSQANIFNDVVIGPAEKDTSRAYYNAYVLGTLNMFGGTIQNGVSKTDGASGNVTVGKDGVLNMFGGTIKGGETTFRGGNVLMLSNSTLNMNHKDALITEGTAAAVASQDSGGGNIATVGSASNVQINVNDGTISKGQATSNADYKGGGNIYAWGTSGVVINLNGGLVTEGEAYQGGNIYVRNGVTVNVGKDAVVSNGVARSTGGNVFLFNGASIITEGSILDGNAVSGGGNINAQGHKSYSATYVTVNGGVISGGTTTGASAWGGNIRGYNAKITVNDGYIYGGTSVATAYHAGAANIGSMGDAGTINQPTLYINGGHIAGDIRTYVSTDSTCKTEVKLSGAPEIAMSITLADGQTVVKAKHAGLYFQSGVVADISGLQPEAKITVSVVKDQVISLASNNAAAVADCFTTTNATLAVEAVEDVLKAVTAPVTPAPNPAE